MICAFASTGRRRPPNGEVGLAMSWPPKLGKLQKRIKRAFMAQPGAELTTGDLVRWCYPRPASQTRRKQRFAIRRAAPAVAVEVRRVSNHTIVWMAKPPETD